MVGVRVAFPTCVKALAYLEMRQLNRLRNAVFFYQGMASAMPQQQQNEFGL
jgi:hypothetical protein